MLYYERIFFHVFSLLCLCLEGWLTHSLHVLTFLTFSLCSQSCNNRIICVDCKQSTMMSSSLLKLLVFCWVQTVKTLFLLFLRGEIKPFSWWRRNFIFSVLQLFTFTLLGLFPGRRFTDLTTLILCLFKVNQDKWAPGCVPLNLWAVSGDELNTPLCLNSNQSCCTHRLRG